MGRFFPLILSFLIFCGEATADTLVLNTGTRNPYTTEDRQGFLDLLVAETFRRAGLKAEVLVYKASKRALINANTGIDDGAAMRVKSLNKTYTNLIRIPEKIIDNDFVGYTLGPTFMTPNWRSLDPYFVGHILGWKVFEGKLDHVKGKTTARGPEQLLELLKRGRVDVILYERWQGLWRGRQLGLDIKVLEPPLAKREMFLFLHKKHAAIVDKVTESLRAMKRDGAYQSIVNKTLMSLLNRGS